VSTTPPADHPSNDHPSDEPARLRDTLAAVGADLGLPAPDAVASLSQLWPELAGAELAVHSRIGALREGVLTVLVDASAWATQLRYREPEVLARAAAVVGDGVVRGLRIRVERPS
jgi:predicted nucleic acid-binding Zn ribbon protein